ncbi:histidine phosphatase family protein, partial [Caballeronia grimmiae]
MNNVLRAMHANDAEQDNTGRSKSSASTQNACQHGFIGRASRTFSVRERWGCRICRRPYSSKQMKARHVTWALATTALAGAASTPLDALAAGDTTQTIVMVRHGEKPDQGLGQLSCQGLNRAMKLPRIIEKKFGRPDAIFASSPSEKKTDR